jgi:peptidoglycan/LPS O-acetylase OafA/YrhL
MYPFFSLYLDICRSMAALTVFLGHLNFTPTETRFFQRTNLGYDAVIIFFVLSGYVISFATAQIEKTGYNFIVSRIARILPVAAAAIFLSAVLLYIAHDYRPDRYPDAYQLNHVAYYSILSLLFLNNCWWLNLTPFGDGPYWTLPFEVWDYAFYGVLIFWKGYRRWLGLALILTLNGPKFLLLLPVWFAGSLAYHWRDRFPISKRSAIVVSICPLVLYLLSHAFLPSAWDYPLAGQPLESFLGHGLDGAARFMWAIILGLLFAVHLWGVQKYSRVKLVKKFPFATPIRWLAGFSFSLYLYHGPIANFIEAYLMPKGMDSRLQNKVVLFFVVLVATYGLAIITEHRKAYLKRLLLNLPWNRKRSNMESVTEKV